MGSVKIGSFGGKITKGVLVDALVRDDDIEGFAIIAKCKCGEFWTSWVGLDGAELVFGAAALRDEAMADAKA